MLKYFTKKKKIIAESLKIGIIAQMERAPVGAL